MPTAYGHPKGGNPPYMMSPGSRESGFGSGIPSGGTTAEPSVLGANNDLDQDFPTEEETPTNYSYQPYPENQHRGMCCMCTCMWCVLYYVLVHMSDKFVVNKCMCVICLLVECNRL